jgi:transcriptional repressor NF-X1
VYIDAFHFFPLCRCCPAANSNFMAQLDGSESRDPHLCLLPCGKKLRCKQHTCQELCHPGHCPPCMETTFTELSCACGRTSIPPPVPCGTPLPSCQFPCSVPQASNFSPHRYYNFDEFRSSSSLDILLDILA